MPFLSTFLISISSPTASKQKPSTSYPQATLATVAGENIFISFIFIWNKIDYKTFVFNSIYLTIFEQISEKRHICTIIFVNTLIKPKYIRYYYEKRIGLERYSDFKPITE